MDSESFTTGRTLAPPRPSPSQRGKRTPGPGKGPMLLVAGQAQAPGRQWQTSICQPPSLLGASWPRGTPPSPASLTQDIAREAERTVCRLSSVGHPGQLPRATPPWAECEGGQAEVCGRGGRGGRWGSQDQQGRRDIGLPPAWAAEYHLAISRGSPKIAGRGRDKYTGQGRRLPWGHCWSRCWWELGNRWGGEGCGPRSRLPGAGT